MPTRANVSSLHDPKESLSPQLSHNDFSDHAPIPIDTFSQDTILIETGMFKKAQAGFVRFQYFRPDPVVIKVSK